MFIKSAKNNQNLVIAAAKFVEEDCILVRFKIFESFKKEEKSKL